jgi:hypothetical protein
MENFNTYYFIRCGHSNKYTVTKKSCLRKVGFLVLDLTWKLFSQTGNIETYLLLKELEDESSSADISKAANEMSSLDTNM